MILDLLSGVVGAALLLFGMVSAYAIGRALTDQGTMQVRATNREMMADRKECHRQIAAIDDFVGKLMMDHRTHPHTRLELEELKRLTTARRNHYTSDSGVT